MSATQNVGVDVMDCLAAIDASVEHNPMAVARLISCDACRNRQNMSGEIGIADELFDIGEVLLGNDKHVSRRFGIDIAERKDPIVFVNHRRWNFAGANLAK